MAEIMSFLMACWVIVVMATLIIIIASAIQTGPADRRSVPSRRVKSLMLSLALIDLSPLCITGMLVHRLWAPGEGQSDTMFCQDVRVAIIPVIVVFGVLIGVMVWLRHSFMLQRVHSGMDESLDQSFMDHSLDQSPEVSISTRSPAQGHKSKTDIEKDNPHILGLASPYRALATGPPVCLVYLVCCLVCVVVLVDNLWTMLPGSRTGTLCLVNIDKPVVSDSVMMWQLCFALLQFYCVAIFTNKTLTETTPCIGRETTKDILFDNTASNSAGRAGSESAIILFLTASSIWLPVVQCFAMCVMFAFPPMLVNGIVILVWLYTTCACVWSLLCVSATLGTAPAQVLNSSRDDNFNMRVPKGLREKRDLA